MSNRQIDELLYSLKKKLTGKFSNIELSILLSNGLLNDFIRNEFSDDFDCDKIIKKIVTDFYAYFLYKIEIGDDVDDFVRNILDELIELEGDNIDEYINNNMLIFSFMIDKYFEYHENSIIYQCMVMANIVNKRRISEFEDLYDDFFSVDFNYDSLVLPKLINCGLQLRDYYNNDDKRILNYLNNEFESPIEKNYFLNYILSNVYVYLKLNGCDSEDDVNLVKLTEKLDRRMKCYYDDSTFIIKLVKRYFDIYGDIKWFEFKDIRDDIDFKEIDLIYKLDDSYKHPFDIMKNADNISTIFDYIINFVNGVLEKLTLQEKTEDEIINWFNKLFNNEISIKYDNFFFNEENYKYFNDLIKLYFLSSYYEYCNYNRDNLYDCEESLYDFIDSGIDINDGLEIYDNEEDQKNIIGLTIKYIFSKETDEFRAKKKIVDDGKLKNILRLNPYILLEYRRLFGILLPNETSKSTEYGNIILEILSNIIPYVNNLEDNGYQRVAKIFKRDYYEINMDLNEIVGFIISNIYENLITKEKLSEDENNFVKNLENNIIDIDDIINNDDLLGEILFYFFSLNDEYLNDDKLKNLRNSGNREKVKVLKKYDPFYEIDREILK